MSQRYHRHASADWPSSSTDEAGFDPRERGVSRSQSYDEYKASSPSVPVAAAAAAAPMGSSSHHSGDGGTLYDELIRYHSNMEEAPGSISASTQSSDKKPAAKPSPPRERHRDDDNDDHSPSMTMGRRHFSPERYSTRSPDRHRYERSIPGDAHAAAAPGEGSNASSAATLRASSPAKAASSGTFRPPIPRGYFSASSSSGVGEDRSQSPDAAAPESGGFSPTASRPKPPSLMSPQLPSLGGVESLDNEQNDDFVDPLGAFSEGVPSSSSARANPDIALAQRMHQDEEMQRLGLQDPTRNSNTPQKVAGEETHGALQHALSSNVEEDQDLAEQLLKEEEEMNRKRRDQAILYQKEQERILQQRSDHILSDDEVLARRLQEAETGANTISLEEQHQDEELARRLQEEEAPLHRGSEEDNELLHQDEEFARKIMEEEEEAHRAAQMQRVHDVSPMDDELVRREMASGSGGQSLDEQRRILERIQNEEESKQLQWAMRESGSSSSDDRFYNPSRSSGGGPMGYSRPPPRDERPRVGAPPWQESQEHAWADYAGSRAPQRHPSYQRPPDYPPPSHHPPPRYQGELPPVSYHHPRPRDSYGRYPEEDVYYEQGRRPSSQEIQRQEIVTRGQEETAHAIRSGQSHVVLCQGCNTRLQAPVHYSLVYCPHCGCVSPGQTNTG